MLAFAAMAQSPSCGELRSTDVPFAVTYEVRTTAPGKGEVAPSRQEQRQVFRKDGETVVYTVQTPAIFLRTRGSNPLLPTEYLYSSHPPARIRTYSLDTSVDYLSQRQPVLFSSQMTGRDGHLFLDVRMRLDFAGTGRVDVDECTFEVVKIIQTLDGTAERAPISNSEEMWMSPELRVPLYRKVVAAGLEVTSIAVAISKDFKRVE